MTLFTISAVATYLPKRKADKKKSLLGNPKDSDESHVEVEVCLYRNFCMLLC